MNTPVVKLFADVGLVYTGVFTKFDEVVCRTETFAILVNHILCEQYGGTALLKLNTDSRIIYCAVGPHSVVKNTGGEDLISLINKRVQEIRQRVHKAELVRVNLSINKYGVYDTKEGFVFDLSNKSSESGNFKVVRANRVENLLRLHFG